MGDHGEGRSRNLRETVTKMRRVHGNLCIQIVGTVSGEEVKMLCVGMKAQKEDGNSMKR